jgi:NADP-dependent 3-hydroxy acid dehydrogenase YdfG
MSGITNSGLFLKFWNTLVVIICRFVNSDTAAYRTNGFLEHNGSYALKPLFLCYLHQNYRSGMIRSIGFSLQTIYIRVCRNHDCPAETMRPLENRLIIISGASSGIGRAVVEALSGHHPRLVIIGRNVEALKRIVAEYGDRLDISDFKVDLSRDDEIEGFIKHLKDRKLEADILIHCAGIFHHAPIQEASNESIDLVFQVNFRAPFIMTRALLDDIIQHMGQVLFINSTASNDPKINTSVYSSSKSALKTFAEVLYREVHHHGVRIATIYPGMVATPMQEMVCKQEGRPYIPENYLQPEIIAQQVIQLLTLPENAEIRDITIKPPRYPLSKGPSPTTGIRLP